MKKLYKRIFGIILALALCFSSIPAYAITNQDDTTVTEQTEETTVTEQADENQNEENSTEPPEEPTNEDVSETDEESEPDEMIDDFEQLDIGIMQTSGYTTWHTRSDYRIYYGNHRTSYYTANGNPAFCLNPNQSGIDTGTYSISRYIYPGTGYDLLIKGAWYLYGGPGYNSVKHNLFDDPDGELAYAYSHAILAYMWTGDEANAFIGQSAGAKQHFHNVIASVNSQAMPPSNFWVFVYNEENTELQTFLGWEYTPTGSLEIIKTSSNPGMTDNNPLYSLEGAVFDVFNGANQKLGSITTDINGRGRLDDIDAGQSGLFIVEVKPPKGFALYTERVQFEIVSGQTTTVTVSNKPQNDPVGIILRKQDADTSAPTAQGNALLSGAEFTVKYYAGLYSNASQLAGVAPARTWVLRTNENGVAFLLPSFLVSGDPFYYSGNGNPTLPLGTLTIQETKAPEGYLINNELFIRQITSDGVAESVFTYNVPIVPDNVIRGGVEIEKWDIERNQARQKQGDATLAGAVLDIWNRSVNSVVVGGKVYAPNTVVYTMTTNADGFAGTANNLLPYGDYEIIERMPPTGYLNTGIISQSFNIRQNGVIVSLKASDAVIKNDIIRGGVEIEKWDIERDQTKLKQGEGTLALAVFDIWNRSADSVLVNGVLRPPNTVVHTMVTDTDGWAGTSNTLLPYGSYEIIERLPPTGYLNSGITKQSFQIRQHGVIVNLSTSDGAIKNYVVRGGVEIEKWDIERDQTKLKQGDATLEGAVFDIWNRSADSVIVNGVLRAPNTVVHTITTNADGWAGTEGNLLPYGNYEIIERTPPTGYLNTGIIRQSFQIRQHGVIVSLRTGSTVIKNDIIRGGVYIEKWDNEIDRREAQGNATLEGAVFEIVNRSIDSVLVKGVLYANGEVVFTLKTDSEGTAQTSNDLLPYGTYEIREVSPPLRGYLATGVLSRIFEIREHGVIVEMNTTDTAIKNDPIRGDLRGVKISGGNAYRMAGVPFRITSITTGESHVIITDANGEFNTHSSWNPHSQNTNRGETDRDGIWFGEIETLNDDVGALLFDTYLIEELRCEANEGRELFLFEVSVYRHNHVINLGTLTNEYVPVPEIGTTAMDRETTTNKAFVSETTTLIDTVYYSGLQPGKWYTLKGILMDKATGKPLLDDGEEITSELTFRAFAEAGAVTMEFTFNSLLLGGKSVVVFEHLYLDGIEIATHADIDDEGQTVTFFDPEIGTDATGKDGNKIIPLDEKAVVIDVVKYENLVAGETYTLKGILMLKETGEPVLINGKTVTSEVTFVAEGSSGTVEVVFTFDSTELDSKELVVFEYLYYKGRLIAEHTDIDDEAQTVTVESEEPPPPPPAPPPAPPVVPPPTPPKSPQTGHDGLPVWLLIIVMVLVVAAVIATVYTIRRWKPDLDE